MNWLDEQIISQMNPDIPFEVYTHGDRTKCIGVRNLTSEIIVHYPNEVVLYGPASYQECCEFMDDIKDIIFKKKGSH